MTLAAGTGEDRLDGKFHGLFDIERSAVGLQDVDRDVDPPFADEAEDLRDEMTVPFPDGLVEIGRRDAAGEIEMPRHAVAERDMVQPVVDDRFESGFLLGIPRGKFADDAAMLDARGMEMVADSFGLFRIDVFNLDTAMIYVAGKKVGFIRGAEKGRGKAGAADDHQPDTVDLVLHNGVCRDGGAEDDPFETADRLLVDQLGGDCEEGCKKVLFVGEDFGLFPDREVIDENRIGMRTPHIYAQDHDHTSPA